mgnify:CR=1 FL=1
MRGRLTALLAALMFVLTPATAAHADETPEVRLSVESILLDPVKGGTQTVRVSGNPDAVLRIYVDGYSTINGKLAIQRGGKKCNDGSPCSGTGDVTITYPAIDKYSANLRSRLPERRHPG